MSYCSVSAASEPVNTGSSRSRRSIRFTSSSGLNGFRRIADAPAASASTLLVSPPVRRITFGMPNDSDAASILQSSGPLAPGSATSSTTSFGRQKRAKSAACSADAASSTAYSSLASVVRSNSRSAASSSTTRIRVRCSPHSATRDPPGAADESSDGGPQHPIRGNYRRRSRPSNALCGKFTRSSEACLTDESGRSRSSADARYDKGGPMAGYYLGLAGAWVQLVESTQDQS